MLDRQPNLRRAFPQLLSIRDLDSLLSRVVNRDIVERSRIAFAYASDLVPVFVPTSAYRRAWKVLHDHRFAVLEGPPEMGKTAIAWMVGLVQLLNGWEAIVCNTPQEFFRSVEKGRSQVFIADDAFGRTEYDPSRGRQWEQDIDRVLRAVDAHHWLLWTSRKHILERALRDLDLQGRSAGFPKPGEVLVDASRLKIEEKALMLYRHARTATLDDDEVKVVKQHARFIVNHDSFTPERIRRFVIDTLPGCATSLKEKGAAGIREKINKAISNPTDRMRKTFRALSISHKWLLVGMLECEPWADTNTVRFAYEAHCPADVRRDFTDTADELNESFINVHSFRNRSVLSWVHPSYRDLVIEELSSDTVFRKGFLRTCSVDGLKLAVSEAGGASGERRLPLMVDAESWTILQQRAIDLIKNVSPSEACDVLASVTAVIESANDDQTKQRLVSMLTAACETARKKWDAECTPLTGTQLLAYGHATTHLVALPKMPDLNASWNEGDCRLHGQLQRDLSDPLDANELEAWIDLVTAINKTEPRFIAKREFPVSYDDKIEALLARIDDECAVDNNDDSEEMRAEADRLSSLAKVVNGLSECGDKHVNQSIELHNRLLDAVIELRRGADELDGPEPDYDDEGSHSAGFDITALFSDL